MPVVKYVMEQFPYVTFIVWVPDYFYDFAKHLLPNAVIRPFKEAKAKYNQRIGTRSTSKNGAYTNLRCHLVDQAFHVLANEHPPIEAKNYLKLNTDNIDVTKFNLPEKYVVICCGYTAPIREMLPEYVNTIADYINNKGYSVIFLGKRQSEVLVGEKTLIGHFKEEIDYSKGIDLIDETTLLETGKIIANAKTIVGLDNGLFHIAGCTDTPIIGGFTSVDPLHRMPYRHDQLGWNFYPVVPPDSEPEKFFQSRWDFLFQHDYRFPFIEEDSTLVKSLRPELYIEQLEKVL